MNVDGEALERLAAWLIGLHLENSCGRRTVGTNRFFVTESYEYGKNIADMEFIYSNVKKLA